MSAPSGVSPRASGVAAPVTLPASSALTLADLDAEVEAHVHTARRRTTYAVIPPTTPGGDQASRLRALMGEANPSEQTLDDLPPARPPAAALAPLTIAVASGKGGVGKTNLAVNLAAALAGLGHRVTLLDADLGTANADVLCGLVPAARLDHVLTGPLECHDGGRRTLRDILIEAPGGFRLIPGSAGIARMADLGLSDRRALLFALSELDHDTDVLVIDTAAGVGSTVTSFIDASDTCLVVSTPEPTSVADAYALIKCGATTPTGFAAWPGGRPGRAGEIGVVPRFQLVMNQCGDALEARRVAARIGAVCDRFLGQSVPMLGWVAQDVRVGEAVRARQPLILRSPGAEATRNILSLAAALAQQLDLPDRQTPRSTPPGRLASALRRLLGVAPSA